MATNNNNNDATKTGVAGRTDYRQWDRVASDLVEDVEAEEQKEAETSAKALGLDGKYARSEAEAEERKKAKEVRKAKKVLEGYKKREGQYMQDLSELFSKEKHCYEQTNYHNEEHRVVRITRDRIDAGKRVLTLSDTSGSSPKQDMIVLSQDLNHLESTMPANAMQPVKQYEGDVDNGVVDDSSTKEQKKMRKVYGLIKLFISNVHDCTIVLRCKLISGTVEMSHCSNVVLKIEKEATVATLQADLCQDVSIEFRDAVSGKNSGVPGQTTVYWGEDKDDRIFHAGVSNMKVSLIRDGFVETETVADYEKDGAVALGNATAEEYQFVTSVFDGELITERVIRSGATTGKNARAMTKRELEEERVKRERVAEKAIKKADELQHGEKNAELSKLKKVTTVEPASREVIEEVYTSMSKMEIDDIVRECEENKARGNEAFGAGEYAQAVLLYSLALDKADELPDKNSSGKDQLFPRHVVLSNRSASFLKLGELEKALADATRAQEIEPTYVKALFRRGVALHAMGKYREAIPVLAEAQKLEPTNKQIRQALQFCEVRMQQEMRKRME